MSHRKSTLKKPDAEFLAHATTINMQCTENKDTWNIEANRLTSFSNLLTKAHDAYEVNMDKTTKNAITSANKKTAFEELKHFMGPFIDYLVANTYVPDEALEYMGLRSRHRHARQPLPRPKEEILISVKKQHGEMTVYAARPEYDHPVSGISTAKHHGFIVRYREDGKEDKFALSTRLHLTLFFEREDEGKRVWISAAWINPRLETGPWCNEISEIIG
jgi:hypothetical protein